ncbi:uncharacterized protein PRCAT00000614001 [Priceomyces carsonii]|uniref:uncharacterized protein n=1 Tax=Priceomyces carsonii TaxID=28549 RepID=UPI002ED7DCF5|nr:unnamed protein product [Priceomyces carsonii]
MSNLLVDFETKQSSLGSENEVHPKKRKSKSPITQTKKQKVPNVDVESTLNANEDESLEDIAKQYKKFINAPKFNLNSEEVFCVCRKPDYGEDMMISCDGCDEWFHFACMKLDLKYSKLISKFYCKFCKWNGLGSTLWKRKCRLKDCLEPIGLDMRSKYCCEEHGILYMKQVLTERNRTKYDLQNSEIKGILDYSKGDYKMFTHLGSVFPELPEVVEYLKDNSKLERFPSNIRDSLISINSKIQKSRSSIAEFELKLRYLSRIKEKIKIINERIFERLQSEGRDMVTKRPSQEPKSKSKTSDLCCYDKSLLGLDAKDSELTRLVESNDINDDFNEDISELVEFYVTSHEVESSSQFYKDGICIHDRKKCIRHKGWWNLVNDELNKTLNDLYDDLRKFESEKTSILRKYSIDIYESTGS